jgi:hypothetical protein
MEGTEAATVGHRVGLTFLVILIVGRVGATFKVSIRLSEANKLDHLKFIYIEFSSFEV